MKGQTRANGVIEAAQEAQGSVVETAQMLRETASDVVGKASDVAGKAQGYAREAGRQAGAAAQTAYSTGNEMLDMVEGVARQNIWPALLIAAAAGYGLACLVKTTTR
jgi:ElaB/YqjD/DUF883 family membrane-anchored ribosome-binding protein